jgi:hypothetical protein
MSDTNAEDLITSAFEQLPRQKKVEVIQELAYILSQDLGHLNDPVLDRETDILCGLSDNIEQRLEEIKAIYGVG